MFRFSIRTLLVAVVLIGAGLATILSASKQTLILVELIATLVPVMAVLLAMRSKNESHAMWLGVAVFGLWAYGFMQGSAALSRNCRDTFQSNVAKSLEDRLGHLHASFVPDETTRELHLSYGRPLLPAKVMKQQFPSEWDTKEHYVKEMLGYTAGQIAWWDLQIALSLLGGVIARAVWRPHRKDGE